MFTKSLSRIALISGLILGASTIVPQVAFAADRTGESSGGITVNEQEYTNIEWIPSDNTFNINYGLPNSELGLAAGTKSIGTVSYVTNVRGKWTIKAGSTNTGKLTGGTETGVTINYAVKLDSGAAAGTGPLGTSEGFISPGATATPVLLVNETTGITDTPTDVTSASLYIKIEESASKVVAQTYTDTLTLVFTSGIE